MNIGHYRQSWFETPSTLTLALGVLLFQSVILLPLFRPTSALNNKVESSATERVLIITTSVEPPVLNGEEGDGVDAKTQWDSAAVSGGGWRRWKRDASEKVNSSQRVLPEIYSFRVETNIQYRYSRTLVTSRVANKDLKQAQEVTFKVVLPETAFISKFIMEIDGKAYEAHVKEKEEAKRDYIHAQSQGESAGLIEKSSRNSEMFHMNVNIKPQTKVTFNLTYEELLSRKLGRYEQVINVNPDQVSSFDDYEIIVNIEESRNLSFLRVPSLSNDIDAQNSEGNNPNAIIKRPSFNKARISWSPNAADQKKLEKDGISGKFLVQYDVDREADAGQILVMQGYFVHFFAPENLPPLRKHVVFILDISTSMQGRKMEQLKESQQKILDDLSPDDFFNIITFSSGVHLWLPNSTRRKPLPATKKNVNKAKAFIDSLAADGGTNIHDAISEALNLIGKEEGKNHKKEGGSPSPFIIFLTDGQPTVGITGHQDIQKLIQIANRNLSIPIFSLGFGDGVDFQFLKKLSLQNHGLARKIYEASDAVLQLKGFYNEISSPLLSNVKFNYTSDNYNITDVTVTRFPTVFGGTEIAVAGKLLASTLSSILTPPLNRLSTACDFTQTDRHHFDVNVDGIGRDGELDLKNVNVFERFESRCGVVIDIPTIFLPDPPVPSTTTPPPTPEDTFLERLWAYLTIRQLLEKDLAGLDDGDSSVIRTGKKGETGKERALRIALRYGFVTPLTSLVVVKPNSSVLAIGAYEIQVDDFSNVFFNFGSNDDRRKIYYSYSPTLSVPLLFCVGVTVLFGFLVLCGVCICCIRTCRKTSCKIAI